MEFKDNLGKLRVTLDGKPPRCYWLIEPHLYLSQFAWALALVLVLGGTMRGQTQSKSTKQSPAPAAGGSPDAVAADTWQKLTTKCSIPGSAAPATFYEDTQTDLLFRVTHRIFELRGARVVYRADTLSEADTLNGIQASGFADLYYSAFREMALQGPPHQADLIPPLPRHGWSEFTAIGGLFRPLRLKMEKRNGQWSFKGWNAFDNEFDLNAVARNKSWCTALTSPDPFSETAERGRVAGGKANEAARKDADLRRMLFTQRDLGNALICQGSRLQTSLDGEFGRVFSRALLVKIVGASEEAGVLGDLLRVKPMQNLTDTGLRPNELQAIAAGGRVWAGDGFYFVRLGDVKAECPNELVRPQPGLVSGSALAEGVKAAGSIDAWPAFHKRAENDKQSSLNSGALTADEFVAKLADAVQRRGAELGEDPAEYPAAIERVSKAVHTCASMPPSTYMASLDNIGAPRFNSQSPYFVCIGSGTPWLPAPGSSVAWRMNIRGLRERWQAEQKNWFGPKLQVEVWMYPKTEAPFDKKFIVLSSEIRDNSATQAADAVPAADVASAAANPLARPSSVRTGQEVVKVCANAKLFAAPPIGQAAQGSGTVLGTTDAGDQGIVLQRGQRVSRIQFEVSGRKLTGWLSNNALCPAP